MNAKMTKKEKRKIIQEKSTFHLKDFEATSLKYLNKYKPFQKELEAIDRDELLLYLEENIENDLYDRGFLFQFHTNGIKEASEQNYKLKTKLNTFKCYVNNTTFHLTLDKYIKRCFNLNVKHYAPYCTKVYLYYYKEINRAMKNVYKNYCNNYI